MSPFLSHFIFFHDNHTTQFPSFLIRISSLDLLWLYIFSYLHLQPLSCTLDRYVHELILLPLQLNLIQYYLCYYFYCIYHVNIYFWFKCFCHNTLYFNRCSSQVYLGSDVLDIVIVTASSSIIFRNWKIFWTHLSICVSYFVIIPIISIARRTIKVIIARIIFSLTIIGFFLSYNSWRYIFYL